MGSGTSGLYSSTNGGSQPYAETYSVVQSEKAKDMKDKEIYDPQRGYFHNPTATSLENAHNGRYFTIDGKKAEGLFMYVLDKDGNLIIGKRCNPNNSHKRSPHPTLIGGKNPEVQCAGMIEFRKGRIYSVDIQSGHFRPNTKSLEKVDKILSDLYKKNPGLFNPKSQWSKRDEQ